MSMSTETNAAPHRPPGPLNNKWIATVASIWIQTACGVSYTFGIYSSALKTSQSYSQSTLDTISVFKDIGANAGVLAGLLYSALPKRDNAAASFWVPGAWVVHLVGAIQYLVGYFMIWASVVGLMAKPPVALMCFYMWMAAHAQTFVNTANVVNGVRNFGDYGGTIIGINKGYLGLGGAVLIQVYQSVLNDHPSAFILMLALLPTFVTLLCMFFVRPYDATGGNDKKRLNSFSVASLIIAAYVMILIILKSVLTFPLSARIITFIILLHLICLPLRTAVLAIREDREGGGSDHESQTGDQKISTSSRDSPASPTETKQEGTKDINVMQSMCIMSFWLMFIAMVCGLGSGLSAINNIRQIGESLGYTSVRINTLVSLMSIWNFLGRFGGGFLSDLLFYKRGWSRPLLMAFGLFVLAIGHVIIAIGFSGNLYIGSILVGICYGSLWSLMPTITSDIFGVTHMATIFNTIAIGSPVGSYILSVRVIGYIYDKKAKANGGHSCIGTHCFMLSFFILASVAFFGCLVTLLLFLRTSSFYKQLRDRRLKHISDHKK